MPDALPARMTAIAIKEPGGPDMLVPAEIDRPEPGHGEILIRVGAAPETPQAPGGSDRRSLQQTTTWTSN